MVSAPKIPAASEIEAAVNASLDAGHVAPGDGGVPGPVSMPLTAEAKAEQLEDAATAAAIYAQTRRLVSDRYADMIGLLRNYHFTDPNDKRRSVFVGDVEIRRFVDQESRCDCHGHPPHICASALAGEPVSLHVITLEPRFDVRFRKDRSDA